MPTRERVAEFVAVVEADRHVEAIERFYHEDASMQENQAAPRVGRDLLVETERATLARSQVRTEAAGFVLIEGDEVVIRWVFHFTSRDGKTTRFEELAHQVWRDDRIAVERFFYDPGQLLG